MHCDAYESLRVEMHRLLREDLLRLGARELADTLGDLTVPVMVRFVILLGGWMEEHDYPLSRRAMKWVRDSACGLVVFRHVAHFLMLAWRKRELMTGFKSVKYEPAHKANKLVVLRRSVGQASERRAARGIAPDLI